MVTPLRRRVRGASTMGCLLSLLLFGGAIFYGVQIGRIYFRYYELVEQMRSSARFARNQGDDVIRRDILEVVDRLGIPEEARRISIQRFGNPPSIRIRTEYEERLHLPLGRHLDIPFRPQVERRF